MDDDAKKTALRMIPYGIYVLTAMHGDGRVAGATINWVTQASFSPPLLALGVKGDSFAHEVVSSVGTFALNILGKGQQAVAFAFFRSVVREGNKLGEYSFTTGASGAPILTDATAYVECRLTESIRGGDHSVFVAEVIEAGIQHPFEGRCDEAVLTMADLGEKVYYGG